MKLAGYRYKNKVSCGIIDAEGIIDIPANWPGEEKPPSVLEILQKGEQALSMLGKIITN